MLPTANSNYEKILLAFYNKMNGLPYTVPTAITTSEKLLIEILSSEGGIGGGGSGGAPAEHTHQMSDIIGLRDELNSLFTSSSNGKKLLEVAIANKGVIVEKVDPLPTFQELKNGIDSIEGGGAEIIPLVADMVNVILDNLIRFTVVEKVEYDPGVTKSFTITMG